MLGLALRKYCAAFPKHISASSVSLKRSSYSQESSRSNSSSSSGSGANENTQNANDSSDSRWQSFKKAYLGKDNAWKLGLISLTASGCLGFSAMVYNYGPPPCDEQGNEQPDEYSHLPKPLAYFRRAVKQIVDINKSIQAPVSDKLLPDPLQPPYYQPKYTLVLEVNGVLIHPDWTFTTGWRFKKRPALELFLQQVSSCYEVVAFSQDTAITIAPVLERIDPEGRHLHYRVFREATRYEGGHHIKDLACLNRDLSKVIIVDWNPSAYKLQPKNAFHVDKWDGDESDKRLIDLAAFLRMIAMSNVDDVRPVLEFYSQFENPLEAFREKHEQMMEDNARKQREQATRSTPQKSIFGLRNSRTSQ